MGVYCQTFLRCGNVLVSTRLSLIIIQTACFLRKTNCLRLTQALQHILTKSYVGKTSENVRAAAKVAEEKDPEIPRHGFAVPLRSFGVRDVRILGTGNDGIDQRDRKSLLIFLLRLYRFNILNSACPLTYSEVTLFVFWVLRRRLKDWKKCFTFSILRREEPCPHNLFIFI